MHDYSVKMPNFTLCGEHKQAMTKYFFFFLNLDTALGIQCQEGSPTFLQNKWEGIITYNIDRKNAISFIKGGSHGRRVVGS